MPIKVESANNNDSKSISRPSTSATTPSTVSGNRFQVCFSHQSRFKQIIDKQQKMSSNGNYTFICTKNEISILAPNSATQTLVHTQLIADGFETYVFPSFVGYLELAMGSFELHDAMSKSKENQNNSIVLTVENVDRRTQNNIIVSFISKTITGESIQITPSSITPVLVPLLEKCPRYNIADLPDYSLASTLSMNAGEMKKLFSCGTLFSTHLAIEMTCDKVTLTALPTNVGRGHCEILHDADLSEYNGYDEEQLHVPCPKNIVDRSTVKMNTAAHGTRIRQIFKISTLSSCEKPTTHSNRVVIGMTPNQALFIRFKVTGFSFVTYYFFPQSFHVMKPITITSANTDYSDAKCLDPERSLNYSDSSSSLSSSYSRELLAPPTTEHTECVDYTKCDESEDEDECKQAIQT